MGRQARWIGLSCYLCAWGTVGAASEAVSEHVEGEVLVRFHSAAAAKEHGAQHRSVDAHTVLVRRHGLGESLYQLLRTWRARPSVRTAEPNLVFRVQRGPQHRDLSSTQGALGEVLRALPRPPTPAAPVRVGILDSGVDPRHPDLIGRVDAGVNLITPPPQGADAPPLRPEQRDLTAMDYNGHGTAVASLIGAEHDGVGIDGICPAAELVPIKIFDGDGFGTLADVVRGLAWARANRIDILNMSFGAYEVSPLLADSLTAAQAQGMLLVAAAGNDAAETVALPASHPGVLAIGSADSAGISRFSNFGLGIDFFASGADLLAATTSAHGPHVYAPFSGTSAGTAQVSGLLALLLSQGRRPEAALAELRAQRVPVVRRGGFGRDAYPWLPVERVVATVQGASWEQLAITQLEMARALLPGEPLPLTATLHNLGQEDSAPQQLLLEVQGAPELPPLHLQTVPALPADGHLTVQQQVALPASWLSAGSPAATTALALRLRLAGQAAPLAAAQDVWIRPQPQAEPRLRHISLQPLARSARDVRVQLENTGNLAVPSQRLQIWVEPAVHEGLHHLPPQPLTAPVQVAALAAGSSLTLTLPLTGSLPAEADLTLIAEWGNKAASAQRAVQALHLGAGGEVRLLYSQAAHMGSVEAALGLLQLHGINLPEVHDEGSPWRGTPASTRDFGGAVRIGARNWRWHWPSDWPAYPASAKTLLDGASACDGIDVAFGDAGADTWSTHYWLVGEGDDAGLTGHSALTKIQALMLGGYGSAIEDGAIAAHRAGDRARAWWLLGHAAHLLGDLSTGAHTINRNWHGVVGDPYHDWMGEQGHYRSWPAAVVAQRGSLVDPYQPQLLDVAARIRFLTYTTARIGASFPWHRKNRWLPSGANLAGAARPNDAGDLPHYEAYLQPLLDAIAGGTPRPRSRLDVGADELLDPQGQCVARDAPLRGDRYADCWDGGDGHIDRNNTREPADADGDLSRIADVSYVYAVRAIAGLIYLFGVETGQLPVPEAR